MLNEFGPWATSIDAGSRPQLSAFWRRRLTMLVPTSQTSPALSRRNRLWLAAATILVFALPTFRPVLAADKPQEKAGQKSANKAGPANKATAGGMQYGSSTFSGRVNPNYLSLPYPLSSALSGEKDRAELHLTRDQENKLREISNDYGKRSKAIHAPLDEKKDASEKQRTAIWEEIKPKLVELNKEVHKQVEATLTAEQSAEVKAQTLGGFPLQQLVSKEELRKEVGISDKQLRQLQKLAKTSQKKHTQLNQARKEIEDATLAVVTPQQWEQYGPTVSATMVPGSLNVGLLTTYALGGTQFEPRQKELALSTEQIAKLKEMRAAMESRYREMGKLSASIQAAKSKEESKAKEAELTRMREETHKEWCDKSLAVLTPQQSEILKKLTLRFAFVRQTDSLDSREGNANALGGLFEHFKLSDDQISELRRLCKEKGKMQTQWVREGGQAILQILSPQQQEKLLDAYSKMYAGTTICFSSFGGH